jgi:hypothetical protein
VRALKTIVHLRDKPTNAHLYICSVTQYFLSPSRGFDMPLCAAICMYIGGTIVVTHPDDVTLRLAETCCCVTERVDIC